jgi:hypothetical protein
MIKITKKQILTVLTILIGLTLFVIIKPTVIPHWSIGIYTGSSPFGFIPYKNNPVLTPNDIGNKILSVADPFIVCYNNSYYMFFEIRPLNKPGYIGFASSPDGLNWTYEKPIIKADSHMSYPYVFKCEISRKDEYCMLVENHKRGVRLYVANNFPTEWSFVKTLVRGDFVDPSIVYHDNMWWLFVGEYNPKMTDTLRLFVSHSLLGPWQEHPQSPVITENRNESRPGGRIFNYNGTLFRFAQQGMIGKVRLYGLGDQMFEITSLTTENYEERKVLNTTAFGAKGIGWNALGMHNVDFCQIEPNYFIAVVDGRGW